jgi:hypothetical protein
VTDQQVAALACVVRTRLALERAAAEHDEAVQKALGQKLSYRLVGDSAGPGHGYAQLCRRDKQLRLATPPSLPAVSRADLADAAS